MGPSGSGKSTLMHLLAGLDRPTSGGVSVGGEDITAMGDRRLTKLRRKHIGFVFQSFNLLPTLTAEENVTLPLAIARVKPPAAEVDALLERVGLTDRRHHKPAELSGGQQQRVAIARALIARPTVLFADEPTGNLDSAAGTAVLELLRDAVTVDGQTTVMVTHDPRAAAAADRVLFLADGRIVGDLAAPTEDQIIAAMREATRPMIRVALKSLAARRLRTALTALAVVLGVAMVSGAFTITDTMRGAADSLSRAAYDGTDAVVTARTAFQVEASDWTAEAADRRRGPAGAGARHPGRGRRRRRRHGRGQDHQARRQAGRRRPVLRRRLRRRHAGRRAAHAVPARPRPLGRRPGRGRHRRRHGRGPGLRRRLDGADHHARRRPRRSRSSASRASAA